MVKPKISKNSKNIIKSFLDRKVYETQSQVIEAALQLLLEKQIEEEPKNWDEQGMIDSLLVEQQLLISSKEGKITIQGFILPKKKNEKYYSVEIPALDIHTQGKTKKECLEMAKDAVEAIMDSGKFKVKICITGDFTFTITSSNMKLLSPIMLKRSREKRLLCPDLDINNRNNNG